MRKGATRRTLGGIREKAPQFHSALKNGMRKSLIRNSQKLDQNLKAKIFLVAHMSHSYMAMIGGLFMTLYPCLSYIYSQVLEKWAENTHSIRMDARPSGERFLRE